MVGDCNQEILNPRIPMFLPMLNPGIGSVATQDLGITKKY